MTRTVCPACRDGRLCLQHGTGVMVGDSLHPGESITFVSKPRSQDRVTTPRGEECARCEQVHARCAGHNKAGKPCGQQPIKGMEVCRTHGGKSPQAQAAVARRRIEERAMRELQDRWQHGAEAPITDPLAELARVAGEVVAFKDMLREQVTQLDGTLAYWQEKDYLDGDGGVEWTKAAEDMRAVVAAYERAQDRAAKILAAMVKLDIAGRMLELRTTQAEQIVGAVREGLASVDIGHEIRQATLEAIADRLALITDQSTTPPKELLP